MAGAKFDPKVPELLSALNERIFRLVHERVQDGSLVVRHETYILRPNNSLHYSVDPSLLDFGEEEGFEETCDYTLLEKLVLTPCKSAPEFQSIATQLSPESEERDALENFVSTVALEAIRASSPDDTAHHIDTVVGDFQDKERYYSVKIWLKGIALTDDRVAVSSDLSFRRPTRSDLQERVTSTTVHQNRAFRTTADFSCIADMIVRCDRPIKVQRAVQKLVFALRLFRLGAVETSRYELEAKSFLPFSSFVFGDTFRSGALRYDLSPADGPILSHFFTRIRAFLPNMDGLAVLPNEKPDFLTTALHWYEETLFARFQPEAAVASAVACLEALFLERVQAEITYRLAQRVAAILRCFGFLPLEVRDTLAKDAYDVRSRHVHGEMQDKKWKHENLTELARLVSDYARVSLLIFCQLRTVLPRRDLLLLLDESLLDDSRREELQRWCDQVEYCRKQL